MSQVKLTHYYGQKFGTGKGTVNAVLRVTEEVKDIFESDFTCTLLFGNKYGTTSVTVIGDCAGVGNISSMMELLKGRLNNAFVAQDDKLINLNVKALKQLHLIANECATCNGTGKNHGIFTHLAEYMPEIDQDEGRKLFVKMINNVPDL
ncbi:hypothetical protein [Pseudoalteromonas phage J2-1_QLiu-2017]|nr:hypothetical protein [Pseudoalteromonas phage J2-1_QLiu-2017]